MKNILLKFLIFGITISFLSSCSSDNSDKITFSENQTEKKIEVLYDGKPFTTFTWQENITKPVLYPLFASSGTEITRGFPVIPKAGERADHPHQFGM